MAGAAPPPPPQQAKEPEIPTHAEIFTGGKIRLRQIVLKLTPGNKTKVMEKAKMIYREASTVRISLNWPKNTLTMPVRPAVEILDP